jgi:hypothetical protein
MATDVYYGSTKIGRVSTSGEVFYGDRKVGWVNGNGDIYKEGIPYGWITRTGTVIDRRSMEVGLIDRSGNVVKGSVVIGHADNTSNRYDTGGAALLLLLGRFINSQSSDASPVREPAGSRGVAAI